MNFMPGFLTYILTSDIERRLLDDVSLMKNKMKNKKCRFNSHHWQALRCDSAYHTLYEIFQWWFLSSNVKILLWWLTPGKNFTKEQSQNSKFDFQLDGFKWNQPNCSLRCLISSWSFSLTGNQTKQYFWIFWAFLLDYEEFSYKTSRFRVA